MSTAPHSFNRNDLPQSFRSKGSSLRTEARSNQAAGAIKSFAPWMGVLAMCCIVAIGISGYLTWASLTSSKIAGCGSGNVFDCSHVTNSKWSTFVGIPVSALAIVSYLSLSASLVFAVFQTSSVVKRFAWTAVLTFSLSAGLAAVWFTGLQVFVLQHLCQYCLVAHACGVIAAVVAIWKVPNSLGLLKFAAPLAVSGIAVLAVGQSFAPEPQKFRIETFETAPAAVDTFDAPFEAPVAPPTENPQGNVFEAPVALMLHSNSARAIGRMFSAENMSSVVGQTMAMMAFTSPLQSGSTSAKTPDQSAATKKAAAKTVPAKERRTVGISGNAIQLDVAQWPLNGSVDAKHIFVEMLDYNCPNCRKTHKAVAGAKSILGGDVAVLILPIPLNTMCNSAVTKTDAKFIESCDIAKLAIAVWRIDPQAFGQFHEALFAGDVPMTLAQASGLAKTMVDAGKLDAELASGIPGKYIGSMVQLYERTGKGGVPKLLFPGTSIVGEFSSAQSLADVIRKQTK